MNVENIKGNVVPKVNDEIAPALLVGFSSQQSVTGLALAFDLLLSGFEQRKLPYRLVDFGRLGLADKPGTFHWGRIGSTLWMLLRFYGQLWGVQSVYIVIASSKFGFLRDAMMIWASRLVNAHLVLHLHGGGYRSFYETQSRWLQRFIAHTLAQADTIVILGEQLRDQFAFVPDHEQKVRVVPNGLPFDLQPQTIAPKSLPVTEPIRLLYLSNLMESKGYLILLEACRILHHEYGQAIHCDFCGDFVETSVDDGINAGSVQAHFFQLIEEWNLGDVVTYRGLVRDRQKEQLLQQAHIFVLPTTYPWEGQPISIIEALAFGTPVVATPHRGIPEQVLDGVNGFLTDADANQVAAAIVRLQQDPDRYQQFSQQARQHFDAHFTQQAYLDRLIPTILGGCINQ